MLCSAVSSDLIAESSVEAADERTTDALGVAAVVDDARAGTKCAARRGGKATAESSMPRDRRPMKSL